MTRSPASNLRLLPFASVLSLSSKAAEMIIESQSGSDSCNDTSLTLWGYYKIHPYTRPYTLPVKGTAFETSDIMVLAFAILLIYSPLSLRTCCDKTGGYQQAKIHTYLHRPSVLRYAKLQVRRRDNAKRCKNKKEMLSNKRDIKEKERLRLVRRSSHARLPPLALLIRLVHPDAF